MPALSALNHRARCPAACRETVPVSTLSDAERRRSIGAAIACIAVFAISLGFVAPLIALILESRGTSRTVIGALAAVPSLAIVLTTPFVPAMVARMGLRRFLGTCITIELVLFVLLPIFDQLTAWFLIRALMGASASGLFIASETWINEVAVERSRGRVVAIYTMLISAGFGLGPTIIPLVGIDGWLPFALGAVFIALAAIPLLWAGRLSPVFSGQSGFGVLACMVIAPTLAAAICVSAFKETTIGSLLPVFGVRSGLGEGESALMLTAIAAGALLLQLPIGWLADHLNRYLVLIVCAILGAAGCLALPLLVGHGGVTMWGGLLLWGGVFSGVYTVAMVLIGQRFRGPELVTANAAMGFLWGMGSLTGPPITGVAMDLWDPHGFPIAMFVLTVVFVVFAVGRRLWVRARH